MLILQFVVSFVLSILLFFLYLYKNPSNCIRAIGYAFLFNVLPWTFHGYLGSESNRLGFIPFSFFTYIAIFLAGLLNFNFKIFKKNLLIFSVYLCFALLISFYIFLSIKNFSFLLSYAQYAAMWVINPLSFFIFEKISYTIPKDKIIKDLKFVFICLIIISLIGIFKYIFKIQEDGNFIVNMNRNGTSFLIVAVFLPINMMYYYYNQSRWALLIFTIGSFLFFTNIVLITGRMGFLGFVLSVFLFLLLDKRIKEFCKRLSKFYYVLIFVLFFSVGFLVFSFIGDRVILRLNRTLVTMQTLIEFNDVVGNDYHRYQLLLNAIDIINNNFLFGVGIGRLNYKIIAQELGFYYVSQAHNFYLSYLAQMGVFTFGLVLLFLFLILLKCLYLGIYLKQYIPFICLSSVLFMNLFNEYITVPIWWMFLGISIGIVYSLNKGLYNE